MALSGILFGMSVEPANPLLSLHQQLEAEFQAYADLEIPSTFGNTPAEYSAIHKGVGKMDMPQRGILQLTGRDRLDFLNRFLTNQTFDKQAKTPLPAGGGAYAFLLTVKGRIVADMNVLELGEKTWLEMDRRLVEPARAALDKYIIADDVKLASLVDAMYEIAIHGPKSGEKLGVSSLELLHSTRATFAGVETVVYRDNPCGSDSHIILMPVESAAAVWNHFELRPIGWAAFNAARIEAGRPIMGIDFDETVLPAELGPATLARAVSFTKGCYLGQEIVARMHARGQFSRQLVGIRMSDGALPLAGASVFDEKSNAVGGITSSTVSPRLSNASICLGYVKKAFMATGTELLIPAEGAMRKGKVVEVPFVK